MSKIKTDAIAVPKPLELAILAALLRPRDVPTVALKAAMAFYVEAHRFCSELRSRTPESIFADFYSDQEWLKFSAEALKKAQGDYGLIRWNCVRTRTTTRLGNSSSSKGCR